MGKVYLITGANRGIGFEYVRQLSERTDTTIIATSRNPEKSEELNKLIASHPNVHVVKLDVTDESSVQQAAIAAGKIVDHVDVLILNSAIAQSLSTVLDLPTKVWEEHWRVNVLGAILSYKYFYPLVEKSEAKQIVFISSLAGSIGSYLPFYSSAYGQTKAALNYTMKEISSELDSKGFTVISLHPGAVATDMGDSAKEKVKDTQPEFIDFFDNNMISPVESITEQLKVLDSLTREQNGKFIGYDGSELVF